MPLFNNLDELSNYINKRLLQAMNVVGITAKQHMYDYVKKEMTADLKTKKYIKELMNI